MVLISFQDLYKIHIFPKFHGCGSKIVPATPFWNLNFKWAWQAQFLSHTYETLEKYVFYINLEMILVPFFKTNDRIWDKNFGNSCHIHILSHPWLNYNLHTTNTLTGRAYVVQLLTVVFHMPLSFDNKYESKRLYYSHSISILINIIDCNVYCDCYLYFTIIFNNSGKP